MLIQMNPDVVVADKPLSVCYWCKLGCVFISSNKVFAYKDGSASLTVNCCYDRGCREKHEQFAKQEVPKCNIPKQGS